MILTPEAPSAKRVSEQSSRAFWPQVLQSPESIQESLLRASKEYCIRKEKGRETEEKSLGHRLGVWDNWWDRQGVSQQFTSGVVGEGVLAEILQRVRGNCPKIRFLGGTPAERNCPRNILKLTRKWFEKREKIQKPIRNVTENVQAPLKPLKHFSLALFLRVFHRPKCAQTII